MIRYAAIDIGSNAVRLLIADIIAVNGDKKYKKTTLVRVPLRLGDDAFINQKISAQKSSDLIKTMISFRNLMDVNQVSKYIACATSAMREAKNGKDIVKLVNDIAHINLEIIEGEREANIIYANHVEENLDRDKEYLYIDVGGGSTELSIFEKGKLTASKSFNIGTIRILDNQDKPETWDDMRSWVKKHIKSFKNLSAIGTGGNINKLYRMANEKENEPMSYQKLHDLYDNLNGFSLKERIHVLGLNPDRADVIIPACEIYLTLMKLGGIKKIHVPKVGMVDGIIKTLMEEEGI